MSAYLDDLRRLVDIDSGSYSKAGVDEVGTWTATQLEALGATVERHTNADLGDAIVGTFERDAGPSVVMIGHLDTVFDAGTVARRPFGIKGRRAHGPGVADMKAGILNGLYALRTLRAAAADRVGASGPTSVASWLPVGRLVFIADPDEEIGSPASTPLITRYAASADVALVLEPARADGAIVTSRKGRLELRLEIRGRAAHAGVEIEKGRSAVLEAAHKVVALQALNERLPGVTVNVGVVHGGTRTNVVADSASIALEVRAAQRRDLESMEATIRAIAEDASVEDVRTSVEAVSRHWPMERTVLSERLVRTAVGVAAELGFGLSDAATGGVSDGNTTAGLGVPTLDGLGPVGGLAHSPDEYVELDSIAPRITLLAGLLQAIGQDAALTARRGGP
jgi:glutamate carboxypeptidase